MTLAAGPPWPGWPGSVPTFGSNSLLWGPATEPLQAKEALGLPTSPVVSVETALQTTWMLIVAVASTVAAAVSTGKRGGQDLTLAAGGGGGSGSSISVGPTDTVTTTVAVSTSTHR